LQGAGPPNSGSTYVADDKTHPLLPQAGLAGGGPDRGRPVKPSSGAAAAGQPHPAPGGEISRPGGSSTNAVVRAELERSDFARWTDLHAGRHLRQRSRPVVFFPTTIEEHSNDQHRLRSGVSWVRCDPLKMRGRSICARQAARWREAGWPGKTVEVHPAPEVRCDAHRLGPTQKDAGIQGRRIPVLTPALASYAVAVIGAAASPGECSIAEQARQERSPE
jgi:hypothetical protein